MIHRAADKAGGDWRLVALLVFKTSVGRENVLGGFDSHSPPPFFTLTVPKEYLYPKLHL